MKGVGLPSNEKTDSPRISLHAIIGVSVSLALAFGGYAIHRVDEIEDSLHMHERTTAHVGQEQRAKDVERRISRLELQMQRLNNK